jgi:Protein of unknown function (DUF3300)
MKRLVATLAIVLFGVLSWAPIASAQDANQTQPQQNLGAAQLDALVAPIALYPDALLSEVLMASTYPLEVVEASRWAEANKNLQGDALKAAADKQDWDDSVRALVAAPSVLAMMSDKLTWTQQLGNAVLAQQADVVDAIQRLRAKAQAANKLQTTSQQTVSVQQDQGTPIISIEPASPDMLYVPYYDPSVVYGDWPYPDYPPYYFPPPAGYIAAGALATGIAFGAGYALGRWVSGGYLWGGGFRWHDRNIVVNRPVNIGARATGWQHNPYHRRGIAYSNGDVARRFGGTTAASRFKGTPSLRSSAGAPVLKPNAGNVNRANFGGGYRGNVTSAGTHRQLATGAKGISRSGGNVHARTLSGSYGAHVGGGRQGGGRSLAVASGGRAHVGGFHGSGGFRGGGGGGRGGGRRR